MSKLIKNWDELAKVPPTNGYKIELEKVLDFDNYCCWWIKPIEETEETQKNYFDHHVYLSTHTFYGGHYKYYTKELQSFGFDIELDNWDKENKDE